MGIKHLLGSKHWAMKMNGASLFMAQDGEADIAERETCVPQLEKSFLVFDILISGTHFNWKSSAEPDRLNCHTIGHYYCYTVSCFFKRLK